MQTMLLSLSMLLTAVSKSIELKSLHNNTNYLLFMHLMDGYKSEMKPVAHPQDKLTVNISGSLYQIIHMDQTQNLITISAYFEMRWQDCFLRWDPESWSNATVLYLQSRLLWIPEIYLYYSVEGRTSNKVNMVSDMDVEVQYNGMVKYFLPFTAQALCPIDVKYFPFDRQQCDLKFGTWSHPSSSILYSTMRSEVNIEDFYDNQEWVLQETTMFDSNTTYNNDTFSAVTVIVKIQRQSFYYTFNLVLPSALITLVSLIGFHFPGGSQEYRSSKFRLGIMTLLSMAVLLLSVVTELPKFSSHAIAGKRGSFSSVPLMGIYYFSLLTLISLGTVTSSLFVVMEKAVLKSPPTMPPVLKRILLISSPLNTNSASKMVSIIRRQQRGSRRVRTASKTSQSTAENHLSGYDSLETRGCLNREPRTFDTTVNNAKSNGDCYANSHLLSAVESLRDEIRTALQHDEQRVQTLTKEWMQVIQRLEILSLCVYLILCGLVVTMFFCHGWY